MSCKQGSARKGLTYDVDKDGVVQNVRVSK